jgi:hypothetical protein
MLTTTPAIHPQPPPPQINPISTLNTTPNTIPQPNPDVTTKPTPTPTPIINPQAHPNNILKAYKLNSLEIKLFLEFSPKLKATPSATPNIKPLVTPKITPNLTLPTIKITISIITAINIPVPTPSTKSSQLIGISISQATNALIASAKIQGNRMVMKNTIATSRCKPLL